MMQIIVLSFLLAQYGQYPGGYRGDPRKTTPGDPKQVMPAFTGNVADISDKRLSLESEGSNKMEFHLGRKTEYYKGKDKIKASVIQVGDKVTVEARKAPDGTMDAATVRLEPQAAKRDQ